MPADFGYINARVRAMHSELLAPSAFEDLLATRDLDGFVVALQNTPYARELAEALAHRTGITAVDEALTRNFLHTTRRILGFADGRPRELIELALRRWDLQNLLAVIRGIHTGRPPEEISQTLVAAGELGEVQLRELAAQPDLRAVGGTLATFGHPFAEGMRQAAVAYGEARNLLAAELALERAYAQAIEAGARGNGHDEQVLRWMLQHEVDATNVLTAWKLREAGVPPAEAASFFVPGGGMQPEQFEALVDPETVQNGLIALHLLGFTGVAGDEPVADLERRIQRGLAEEHRNLYRGDPLGIDVVLGHLAAKEHEVANLRLIARAKLLGIPREVVRREMVRV